MEATPISEMDWAFVGLILSYQQSVNMRLHFYKSLKPKTFHPDGQFPFQSFNQEIKADVADVLTGCS